MGREEGNVRKPTEIQDKGGRRQKETGRSAKIRKQKDEKMKGSVKRDGALKHLILFVHRFLNP